MINKIEIKNYDEFKTFINTNDNNIHIVKIGAEWCGPCRTMEQIINDLDENKIHDTSFAFINIDDDNMEQITIDYSIKNIPVLLFFKNGNLIKKEIGVVNANNIYNIINQSL